MLSLSAIIAAPDLWLSFLARLNPDDQNNKTYLSVFACLVGACFIFTIVRAYGFLLVSLKCAERLHDKMVVAILRAPVLFFDSNPVGRILNRFSNDIGCVDELLPKTFLVAMQMLLVIFVQILVTVSTNVWLMFLVVPISVWVFLLSNYYLKTARELKRLESISRSPVFAHFTETLTGLDTIRTRGRQRDFVDALYRYVRDIDSVCDIRVNKCTGNKWVLIYTISTQNYPAIFSELYIFYLPAIHATVSRFFCNPFWYLLRHWSASGLFHIRGTFAKWSYPK